MQGVAQQVSVGGAVFVGVPLDGATGPGRQRHVPVLSRSAVLESGVLTAGLVGLLGDPVHVLGHEVTEIDRGGLSVAQTAPAHQIRYQQESVVTGRADRGQLSG